MRHVLCRLGFHDWDPPRPTGILGDENDADAAFDWWIAFRYCRRCQPLTTNPDRDRLSDCMDRIRDLEGRERRSLERVRAAIDEEWGFSAIDRVTTVLDALLATNEREGRGSS